jgi:hypothetical protein
MKRLLLKILVFFGIIVICDMAVGAIFYHITNNIRTGGQGRDNYISNECMDDVLVFGSSRALHHYDTTLLTDSLGLSAYNCGTDGCGILQAYARLKMVRERHQPKYIILDVVPGYDLLPGKNDQQLIWLKNRYDRDGMGELFQDVDPKNRFKMFSKAYRYNSSFIKSAFVYFTGISEEENIRGFAPIYSKKMRPVATLTEEGSDTIEYDQVKLKYLDKFIQLSKGSRLYFAKSPIWYESDAAKIRELQLLKERCKREGIPFFDFTNHPKYMHVDKYFADGKHMNATGAREFTRDLYAVIKAYEESKVDSTNNPF